MRRRRSSRGYRAHARANSPHTWRCSAFAASKGLVRNSTALNVQPADYSRLVVRSGRSGTKCTVEPLIRWPPQCGSSPHQGTGTRAVAARVRWRGLWGTGQRERQKAHGRHAESLTSRIRHSVARIAWPGAAGEASAGMERCRMCKRARPRSTPAQWVLGGSAACGQLRCRQFRRVGQHSGTAACGHSLVSQYPGAPWSTLEYRSVPLSAACGHSLVSTPQYPRVPWSTPQCSLWSLVSTPQYAPKCITKSQ